MKIHYIVIVLIIFYLYGYFVYPPDITILQTKLKDFHFGILLEKQPIVIEDCIKDIFSVIDSWFSTNIVQDVEFDNRHLWNINSHKYLFIYSLNNTEVYLYPPRYKIVDDKPNENDPILAIKLKNSQSVIIPYKWNYNLKNEDVKLYGIHDYATYFMDFVI